jgi:hypothetical protein
MTKVVKSVGALFLIVLPGCSLKGPTSYPYDVVVMGGTPSAVAAAVAASRQGAKVCLIAQNEHLGGMMSSGLGNTDSGNPDYIGGIAAEVFLKIAAHYRNTYGPESDRFRSCNYGLRFEPHVAEQVFEQLVKAERIELLRGWLLTDCHAELNKIESVTVRHRKTGQQKEIGGLVYIDATYTGDLFAEAGTPFYLGRESRKVLGEKLAGHIYQDHQSREPLPGSTGAGDSLIQAYTYRLCLTDSAENSAEWPEPENFDPGQYRLLYDFIRAKGKLTFKDFMIFSPLPNRKYDIDNNCFCWLSTDLIGASQNYPEATDEERLEIEKRHMEHILGLWKFLRNDPGIPAQLRSQFNRFYPAKDEFTDNRHLPFQIYVREARRLHGIYTFSEKDALTDTLKEDAVGMGSYPMASHATGQLRPGYPWKEGFFIKPCRPYQIPYFIMTPVWVRNLLVSCCVCASHVGYGTLRMEPVFMIMGHAAGVAADLSNKYNCEVDEIPVPELQELLREQGAILSHAGVRPWKEGIKFDIQCVPRKNRAIGVK